MALQSDVLSELLIDIFVSNSILSIQHWFLNSIASSYLLKFTEIGNVGVGGTIVQPF